MSNTGFCVSCTMSVKTLSHIFISCLVIFHYIGPAPNFGFNSFLSLCLGLSLLITEFCIIFLNFLSKYIIIIAAKRYIFACSRLFKIPNVSGFQMYLQNTH